jgi:hypothetical protein
VILKVTSAGPVHLIADVYGYFVTGAPTVAGAFGGVAPARLLDTRFAIGVPTAAAVPANGSVTLTVAGLGGLPETVGAVALNITVVAPQAAGHVAAYPSGGVVPDTSNVNFVAGQTVPNMAIVKVGSDGKVVLKVTSAGPVHLIADVYGYFLDAARDPNNPSGCGEPMSLTFDTSVVAGGEQIAFAISGGSSPVSIDWGGAGVVGNTSGGTGRVQVFPSSPGLVGYTYATAGKYTV